MYQYYTVEMQRTHEGELSHDVKWYWDEDEEKARLKAESGYHEIMSRAAVSDYAMHSAILFSEEGMLVANGCYTHPEDAANESVTVG